MKANIGSIAVIIPVYRGEGTLEQLVSRLICVLESTNIPFRIILVDDRSPDLSWENIKKLTSLHKNLILGIRLSRNFGQHCAITAGLNEVKETHVVIMDCDLQDAPEEIPRLINRLSEGYSIVYAERKNRKDSLISRNGSKVFYSLLSYLTGAKFNEQIANFGIYEKRCIDAVLNMGDHFRFFPVMIQWIGFTSSSIPVEHNARGEGRSTYSFSKKLLLALNVMLFFSEKPLKIQAIAGLCLSSFAFIIGLIYFLMALNGLIRVSGFASLIISIFLLSGLILFSLGLVGLYIGNIFNQVKARPIYLVDERA